MVVRLEDIGICFLDRFQIRSFVLKLASISSLWNFEFDLKQLEEFNSRPVMLASFTVVNVNIWLPTTHIWIMLQILMLEDP